MFMTMTRRPCQPLRRPHGAGQRRVANTGYTSSGVILLRLLHLLVRTYHRADRLCFCLYLTCIPPCALSCFCCIDYAYCMYVVQDQFSFPKRLINLLRASVVQGYTGLVYRHDEQFSNIDMGRTGRGPDNFLRYVFRNDCQCVSDKNDNEMNNNLRGWSPS